MNSTATASTTRLLNRFVWSIAAGWTIVVGVLIAVSIHSNRLQSEETALTQARSNFQRDVIYRHWSAKYGPLYVRINKGISPNPYLTGIPDRDITTTTGEKLTQVNPAYMNRLVFDLAAKEYGIKGHITSLLPGRPENSPDAWEVEALKAFEAGKGEISSIERLDGQPFLRMMRPLVAEKECLGCHQKHGYHEGEIRGGISVGVPMEPLYRIARKDILVSSLSFAFLWLIGLIGIMTGTKRIRRAMEQRERAEQEAVVLNQSLQARKDELEAANRELESFSYTVSHDLQSPLSTISGFCNLIQELPIEKHPEKCARYTGIMHREIQRMENLIKTLLDFSRLSRVEPRRRAVNLSQVAHEISRELQGLDPARSVVFRIEEDITVIGDPMLLRIVMQNLLGNAWKYTGKQKEAVIRFGAIKQDQEQAFFVQDNGAGFEKNKAGRVFDAFQRLHKDEEFKGTGIGLATVKRIITRHNGRVWAEGEPGKGAAIYFTLPEA
jgi:signal transduction histidine kinase